MITMDKLKTMSWWFALLPLSRHLGALGAVKEYHFEIKPALGNMYSPDCQNLQQQRRFLSLVEDSLNGVEASMPGPLIEANEGDTIRLKVTNHHMALSQTIHHHGLHMVGTPWADGPNAITQCALGPMQSQTYEFVAFPPGTHYWHGHLGMDVPDGITGPIIVHPNQPEPYEYDEERLLFLQDFFIQTGVQQEIGLENYPFTWIGNPSSLLINGKGLAPTCLEGGDNFGIEDLCLNTCNDTLSSLSNITVEAGKKYRFRIINSASLVMMNIAIQGHGMTIVEVEGTSVQPVTVQSYDLSPGQRVSVLVTMNQDAGNYWIETVVRERDAPGIVGRAILSYTNNALELPSLDDLPSHPAWNSSEIAKGVEDMLTTLNVSSYEEDELALVVDEDEVDRYVVVGTQNTRIDEDGNSIQLKWAVNNVSLVFPREPLLGTVVRQAQELGWPTEDAIEGTVDLPRYPPIGWNWTQPVQDLGGPGENLGSVGLPVIRISTGQVVEIVLQNALSLRGAAEFHPWHFHGHSFWVVGRGHGNFDETTDVSTYNLENPVLRDTVTLWPEEWVALRFVANNPGTWFFHCHISAHAVMGMGFIVITDPQLVGTPSESVEFCGMNSLKEGSAGVAVNVDNNETNVSAGFVFAKGFVIITMVSLLLFLL